jgi:8-hydroxy-5-deazaflavin:NADPH oxidoreductase
MTKPSAEDHGPRDPVDHGRRKLVAGGIGLAALSLLPSRSFGAGAPSAQNDSSKQLPSPPAHIGVIGAGSLGGTVGGLWVKSGHEVLFSSRHPEELVSMTKELGPRATVGTPRQAAEFGAILLFAVPYDALMDLGRDLAALLRGKVVLDACNPGPSSSSAMAREAEANGVAVTTAKLLAGARVVRAFSAVDATAIAASARRSTKKLGVPIASDDHEALQVAEGLVRDAGCEPVVVGPLSAARGFQRGGPGFRANTDAPELRRLLGL